MEAEGNKYMEAAKEEMEKINQDETERWRYLRREMAVCDEKSRLVTARHEGERIGAVRGENCFAELTRILIEANRLDDLKKATEDEEFRQKLYVEYGIKKA